MLTRKIIVNDLIATRALNVQAVIEVSAVDKEQLAAFENELLDLRTLLDKIVHAAEVARLSPSERSAKQGPVPSPPSDERIAELERRLEMEERYARSNLR